VGAPSISPSMMVFGVSAYAKYSVCVKMQFGNLGIHAEIMIMLGQ